MSSTFVVDCETTGLSVSQGNRVVEVGITHIGSSGEITGLQYQHYFNPKRESEEGAFNCHKLSSEFLASFPINEPNCPQWGTIFALLSGAECIVAQNAPFDLKFLKKEFEVFTGSETPTLNWKEIEAKTVDTRLLAKKLIGVESLDKILAHFGISKGGRDQKHGALEDSHLTAQIYLKLKQLEKEKSNG